MISAPPLPFFEGCEKKIEILFDVQETDGSGVRQVGRRKWAEALHKAGITVESEVGGPESDCYMLSESSLVVSRDRLMCKTCGQSAPLVILPDALRHCRELGCQPRTVIFSRSNLLKPELQPPEHRSFEAETTFLDAVLFPRQQQHAESSSACRQAYQFGDTGGVHWSLYVALLQSECVGQTLSDAEGREGVSGSHSERLGATLEVAMYDMHPIAAARWVPGPERSGRPGGAAVAALQPSRELASVASALVPGLVVDELTFEPCGYSMNACGRGGTYCVAHVTPQAGCSFASFEASVPSVAAAEQVIDVLLEIFKPAQFSSALLELHDRPSKGLTVTQVDGCAGVNGCYGHRGYAMQSECTQQLMLRPASAAFSAAQVGRFHFASYEAAAAAAEAPRDRCCPHDRSSLLTGTVHGPPHQLEQLVGLSRL
jgi:S-adenosylmethionine decarboxylase